MTTTKTAPLGTRTVQRIGFGTMQLTGPNAFGPHPDQAAVRAVLRRAVDLGVNHLDTSQVYGPDLVNELIAEVLHPYADDLVIATKVGGARDEHGGWIAASRPEDLRATVEADLRLLRLERVPLVNLRRGVGGPAADAIPLAEQLGVLTELRDQGKIELIGLSTVDAAVVEEALTITPIAEVQNAYSLVNRTDEAVLELCRRDGIAYVPYFPLGSAYAGGPAALAADPVIAAVASRHGASASQIALAWLLDRYDRMLPIPGTSSLVHLEENLAAGDIVFDDEDRSALEAATQLGSPM